MSNDLQAYLLIGVLGIVTYGTRIGGYLILSRFETINPRIEAALDAIPIAVITALVAPIALATGPAETIGVIVAGAVSIRYSMHVAILTGVPVVALLRLAGL